MSYSTQDWASKTVVTKTGLINMDNQIAANEQNISSHADKITNIETGTTPAGKANQLKDSRTFVANLASTTPVSFNGTGNVSMGVTGVLPVANGGTGSNSIDSTPTKDSTKLVTSGGTYAAIAQAKSMDLELERFGYVCPEINGVKNYVDDDGIFHRKIARVCLADLTWVDYSMYPGYFYADLSDAYLPIRTDVANVHCSKYQATTMNVLSAMSLNKSVALHFSYHRVYVYDNTYSSASAFTSAMSGTYLYYELATEETYSAFDTPSVQSMISDDWIGGNHIYEIGDYCIDNNTLYRCKIRHSDGRPSGTDGYIYWDKCKISDLLGYKVATYSGTTNANGNLDIPTSVVPYSSVVIRAIEANSYCPLVYRDNSAWIVHVVSSAASLPVASNRSVSLTIYYL